MEVTQRSFIASKLSENVASTSSPVAALIIEKGLDSELFLFLGLRKNLAPAVGENFSLLSTITVR